MPQGIDDHRLKNRELKLIKDTWISALNSKQPMESMTENTTEIPDGKTIFSDESFQTLWNRALEKDEKVQLLYNSLANGDRSLPSAISDIKISLAECKFDARGALTFRDRVWIPNYEPLKTSLIQKSHDSHVTGHPGRDSTLAIINRNFFWPGMSRDVRKFCKNCD
ncbi:hypothetical protein K3495_g16990, partial [Podosphaera aphanis]